MALWIECEKHPIVDLCIFPFAALKVEIPHFEVSQGGKLSVRMLIDEGLKFLFSFLIIFVLVGHKSLMIKFHSRHSDLLGLITATLKEEEKNEYLQTKVQN